MKIRSSRRTLGTIAALAAVLPLTFTSLSIAPAYALDAGSPSGVDVSKWQRPGGVTIDWQKVAANGEKFAFIKATDGIDGESPFFKADSEAAAKAGLIIGSYHKAHPNISATKQADEYARALASQPANVKKLPPVLDIELDNGLTPTQLIAWTKEFLNRVEEKTGTQPMVYTYRWFWRNKMANSSDFANYPLWLAAYQNTPPKDVPGGWSKMTFWQYSDAGHVPGIGVIVDRNRFNGTAAELDAFATTGGVTHSESQNAQPSAGALAQQLTGAQNVSAKGSDAQNADTTGADQVGADKTGADKAAANGSLDQPQGQATTGLIDAILTELFKVGGSVGGESPSSRRAGNFFEEAETAGLNSNDAQVLWKYISQIDLSTAQIPTGLLEEMANDATLADVIALLAGVNR